MASLDYYFKGEWSEDASTELKSWMFEKWTSIAQERPEDDFIEYILVMVKNKKKMQEIASELFDLTVDESYANEFVQALGEKLSELSSTSNDAQPVKSKVIALNKASGSMTALSGPLKSSRGGINAEKDASAAGSIQSSGSSRLLNSALQSSRAPHGTEKNSGLKRGINDGDKRDNDNKRIRDNSGQQNINRNVVITGKEQFHNRHYRPDAPSTNAGWPGPQSTAVNGVADTVKYFEQMNAVAQASGFRNAQEMLASQKEMMAIMGGAVPAPAPMPPMHAAPIQQPPYPPTMPPVTPQEHFGFHPQHVIEQGMFPGHNAPQAAFYPPVAGYHSGRGGGRGYRAWVPGGRRGGHGGRGAPGRGDPDAPTGDAGEVPRVLPSVPEGSDVDGTVAHPASGAGRFGGRGPWRGTAPGYASGRGRGRFTSPHYRPAVAAGAAPVGGPVNKTWVRSTNIDSSLVSSR